MKQFICLIIPTLLWAQTTGTPVPSDLACEKWHAEYEMAIADRIYSEARIKLAGVDARMTAFCGSPNWSSEGNGKITCTPTPK